MELSNKKIACVGLLAMSAACAAVTLSVFQGFGDALVDASQTEYVLEFSNSKNKPTRDDVSNESYIVETELGNPIRFEIGLGEFSESGFLTLGVGGNFGNPYDAEEENRNRISGILGITVTGDFREGGLVLCTGFDANQGVSESNSYSLKSGTEANPDFGYSFFQIKNIGSSACDIDSVSVRYSCVVQDASVADLVYELNSERTGYVITGYTGTGGDVVIPSAYKGLPVTSVGNRAFRNCTSLTSIVIPSSVTSVGDYAFYMCNSLTSVTFGEGSQLESIGSKAFCFCYSLTSIVIPSSVTSIGSGAFADCSSLTSIVIPSSVTSVNYGAFQKCTSLEDIVIPSSVTSVGDYAFYLCISITSVTFGEGSQLESIGSSAFYGCSSLTSIVIPSSVTSIGDRAFYNCTSITSVTFAEGYQLESIGSSAFQNCTSLTSVTFAEGLQLESIGYRAFSNCTSLTSIAIPSSVTSIGSGAFEDCSSLTSIVIPSSVTSVGNRAFYDCFSLTIYCEAESRPSGWSSNWNPGNRPVYWAGEWSYVGGVPTPKV